MSTAERAAVPSRCGSPVKVLDADAGGTSARASAGRPVRPRLALVALCLAFFIVQLDVTVVNVALDTIRRDLGGGTGGEQWVVTSYTTALAAGMLTAVALGDRFGSRRVCLIGIAVFALGSALCALAPSMPGLIGARAMQGVGACALLPCSLALMVLQFEPAHERAHAVGVSGGISSIGMAAGPVVGGLLITYFSWRIIFLVNVPSASRPW